MNTDRRRAVLSCAAIVVWAAWVGVHGWTRPAHWHAPIIDAPLTAFPFWRDALIRGLRASAGAALVWTAVWQLGRLTTRTLHDATQDIWGSALFCLAIGTVACMSLLTAIASAGFYTPRVVAASIVVIVLSRPLALVTDIRAGASTLWRRRSDHRTLLEVVFIGITIVALGYALVAALAPESEYDALWYHLWLPREWLAAGRLIDIVPEYISLYPGGWELLNGAAMALGGPIAAKLLHFTCLPLLAVAACVVARQLGVRGRDWLVAALVITAPTMLWEASTAYVDLALAWLLTTMVAAIFAYVSSGDRRLLLTAGVVGGGALAVKHLGLVAVAACAPLLLAYEAARVRPRFAIARVAVYVGIALMLAAPWYTRAFRASGNPVFPEMYRVFGATPDTRWSPGTQAALDRFTGHFGIGRGWRASLELPWNVTTHAARFGGTFGPAFMILIPCVLLLPTTRAQKAVVAGCLVYLAVWASPLGSFQLRFLAPLVPFLAIFAALGATAIASEGGRISRYVSAVAWGAIALVLVMNLPFFIEWHETERRGWDGWLTHVPRSAPLAVVTGAESEDEYLARTVPSYRAWKAIDEQTPPDAVVLTFTGGDHLYSHRTRIWSDATIAYPVTWGAPTGREAQARDAARRLGITHVLFERKALHDPQVAALAIAGDRFRECCLAPVYVDTAMEVDRIVDAPSGSAADR